MGLTSDEYQRIGAALEPAARAANNITDRAIISQAISLKRIADIIEGHPQKLGLIDSLFELVDRMKH
jgi:hypothetical protein